MEFYDYDDFYGELGEFEQQLFVLKDALKSEIKQEVIDEMNKLKKENEELEEVKRNFDDIKREYKEKEYELERLKSNVRDEVRKERLEDLIKSCEPILYKVFEKRNLTEKCDKCDDDRRIKYFTPSGRETFEDCKCKNYFNTFEPREEILVEISSIDKFGRKSLFYKPSASSRDDEDLYVTEGISVNEFSFSSALRKLVENGQDVDYSELEKNNTFFKSKEDAQKYSDYLNEKKENK